MSKDAKITIIFSVAAATTWVLTMLYVVPWVVDFFINFNHLKAV